MTETVITPEKLDELELLAKENHRYGAVVMVDPATILALVRDNRSRRNMLDTVINSVAGALGRAGVTEVDDPGEAIDVLVADKDAEIARLRRVLQMMLDSVHPAYVEDVFMRARVIDAREHARAALNKEQK